MSGIQSQLEQKTVEFENLTKTSNEEINRIKEEMDKKVKELEEQKNTLQTQSQQQLSETTSRNAEELNRLRNEMEQRVHDLEEQKRTLQSQSQQQISEANLRNNDEINRIRTECDQKIKTLENQSQLKDDTIKSHEDTIKTQNAKIDELLAIGSVSITSTDNTVNTTEIMSLLDCALFVGRMQNWQDTSNTGKYSISELSNIDFYKTLWRALNEVTEIQQCKLLEMSASTRNNLNEMDFYKTSTRVLNEVISKKQKKLKNKQVFWKQLRSDN